jgi:hypothetical protein
MSVIQQAILANPNADDDAILAIVNAPVQRKIPLPDVRRLCAANGVLVALELGKQSSNEAVRNLCITADKFIYLPFSEDKVQTGEDHSQFLLLAAGLVQAGILPSAVYANIELLAFDFPQWTLSEVAWQRHLIAVNARKAEVENLKDDLNAAIDAVTVGNPIPSLATLLEGV